MLSHRRRKKPARFGAVAAAATFATGSADSSRIGTGAAGVIRVTAGCSTGSTGCVDVGSGVLFWKTDLGPFGSGTVDSFLRIQDNDSDEQGYNTHAAPEFDETNSLTDAMPLTEAPQATINGVAAALTAKSALS